MHKKIASFNSHRDLKVYALPNLPRDMRLLKEANLDVPQDIAIHLCAGILFLKQVLAASSQFFCGICRKISFGTPTNSILFSSQLAPNAMSLSRFKLGFDMTAVDGNILQVCSSCLNLITARKPPVSSIPSGYSIGSCLANLTFLERVALSLSPSFRIILLFSRGKLSISVIPRARMLMRSELPMPMHCLTSMISCTFDGPVDETNFCDLQVKKDRMVRAIQELRVLDPARFEGLFNHENMEEYPAVEGTPYEIQRCIDDEYGSSLSLARNRPLYMRGDRIAFDPNTVTATLIPHAISDFDTLDVETFRPKIQQYLLSAEPQFGSDYVFISMAYQTSQELAFEHYYSNDELSTENTTAEECYSSILDVLEAVPGGEQTPDLLASKLRGYLVRFGAPSLRVAFNNWGRNNHASIIDKNCDLHLLLSAVSSSYARNPYHKHPRSYDQAHIGPSLAHKAQYFQANLDAILSEVIGWDPRTRTGDGLFGSVVAYLVKVVPGPGDNLGAVILLWQDNGTYEGLIHGRTRVGKCDELCESDKFGTPVWSQVLGSMFEGHHEIHRFRETGHFISIHAGNAIRDFYMNDFVYTDLADRVRYALPSRKPDGLASAKIRIESIRTLAETTVASHFPSSTLQCYVLLGHSILQGSHPSVPLPLSSMLAFVERCFSKICVGERCAEWDNMPSFMDIYANRPNSYSHLSLYSYYTRVAKSTVYMPHAAVLSEETRAIGSPVYLLCPSITDNSRPHWGRPGLGIVAEIYGDIGHLEKLDEEIRNIFHLLLFQHWRDPSDVVILYETPTDAFDNLLTSDEDFDEWTDFYRGLSLLHSVSL